MAGQWWSDDDQLLEVLRDALTTAREVPPGLVAAGKAAYSWRTIDAELAALTYDSAWEGEEVDAHPDCGERQPAPAHVRLGAR